MNFFGFFGWRTSVRRLRKRWDRAREKALRKKDPLRRMALEKLDAIQSNLIILEEQNLTRVDRVRLAKEVEIGIAEVRGLLESKPEEIEA